jgi:hypothetical protein
MAERLATVPEPDCYHKYFRMPIGTHYTFENQNFSIDIVDWPSHTRRRIHPVGLVLVERSCFVLF